MRKPPNLDKLGLKKCFTITYTGAMGKVNALQEFLYLAKEAQHQSKDWQFVLMGKGVKEEELKILSENLALRNVKFLSFGNKHQVRDLLAASDVAYISFDHFPVLRTNSPNKFFDALAMGLAIVVNQKGWIYNLVNEHQLGFYSHPENPTKTTHLLESLAANPQALTIARNNARKLATQHFSKEMAIRKVLFVLDPENFKLDTNDGAYILTA